MSEKPDTRHHSWLTSLLSEQKDRVAMLLRSLSGTGPTGGMKPSIFKRFIMTLEQIAHAKDDEAKLISEIDQIEEEHRRKRKRHMLREAVPDRKPAPDAKLEEPMPEPKRDGTSLIWWVAFLALLRPKVTNK